ncbi:MAG TPA: PaaI family thioesterase [Candidatus Dormibacteraeota bacterium]|nr:PaaI family thioesterase [Candidatus Dormibacteraeota bacterium]
MSSVVELAESAMAKEAGQGAIFDLKVNYISTSRFDEPLTATARVVHSGRRTVFTECRIDAPGGRLVATASATFAVTRQKE